MHGCDIFKGILYSPSNNNALKIDMFQIKVNFLFSRK